MNVRLALVVCLAVISAVAVFVWQSCASLPPIVASHFDGSGAANGFMPRESYCEFILGIVIGIPLLITILPLVVPLNKSKRLKIPHREYWLAPDRRDHTIEFLRIHGMAFPPALSALLGYFHWLTVKANQYQPPMMSHSAAITGLIMFLAYLAIWIAVLFIRFRKPN